MYVRISHAGGLSTRTNISNDTLLYVQYPKQSVCLTFITMQMRLSSIWHYQHVLWVLWCM